MGSLASDSMSTGDDLWILARYLVGRASTANKTKSQSLSEDVLGKRVVALDFSTALRQHPHSTRLTNHLGMLADAEGPPYACWLNGTPLPNFFIRSDQLMKQTLPRTSRLAMNPFGRLLRLVLAIPQARPEFLATIDTRGHSQVLLPFVRLASHHVLGF